MGNNGMMRFVGRSETIEMLHLALSAGEHALLLGPPGTGKSALVEEVARRSGLRYFGTLVSPFTTPDELFGPVDVGGLKVGRYRRLVEGFLPTAEVAFLDEVFKGSSAILNALLRIMQERRFMAEPPIEVKVPLRTLVGASNEMPPSGHEAILDRFLLRQTLQYVSPDKEKLKALISGDGDEVPAWRPVEIDPSQVSLTDEVAGLIEQIVNDLRHEGVVVSDRRIVKGVRLVKVNAAIAGREETTAEDVLCLRWVFWNKPEQEQTVAHIVTHAVCPQLANARAIVAELEKLFSTTSFSDPQRVAELAQRLLGGINELGRLKKTAPTAFRREIEGLQDKLKSMQQGVVQALVGGN